MGPKQTATRQGETRRQEILRQAIDIFGEAGYSGARIDEVARRVGIRRPSILYHFPDKPALYSAAVSDVVQDIVDRILATENHPGERLEAIADTWIDFVIARPNAARVLLRQMIDADPVSLESTRAPVRALLASIQSAIDERFLVLVASRSAIEGSLGLDTLSPQSIQRHRRTLHALTRQLLAAADEAAMAPLQEQRIPQPKKMNKR